MELHLRLQIKKRRTPARLHSGGRATGLLQTGNASQSLCLIDFPPQILTSCLYIYPRSCDLSSRICNLLPLLNLH